MLMASGILVAAIGVVGTYSWTAHAASLEDQYLAANTIVTNTKGLAKARAKVQADAVGPKIVVLKELLKDASAADRSAFAGGLLLGGGRVLSADFSALKKLSEQRETEVKDAFASKSVRKSTPGEPVKRAQLSELLKGVPKPVADEFMDGLLFADGRVVGASTGGLKKAVTPERYREILDMLAEPGAKAPLGMMSLCGNGWCDNSACSSRNGEPLRCRSSTNNTCWSSCN